MGQKISVNELSPTEVHDLLARKQIILVDVREPAEYGAERIHGALLYPLSTFDPAFLPADASRPVVFHCAGGMRSLTAATRQLAAGSEATHMKGGIAAWISAGLPTVRVDPATGKIIDVASV
ncbi:MAG: rhodanese-like domain-containing protein [Steroidobacteraceae bacterium]